MTGIYAVLAMVLLAVIQISLGIYLIVGVGPALMFSGAATIAAAAILRKAV